MRLRDTTEHTWSKMTSGLIQEYVAIGATKKPMDPKTVISSLIILRTMIEENLKDPLQGGKNWQMTYLQKINQNPFDFLL